MGKLLLVALIFGVGLYALIDAFSTPRGSERLLPKWLWILVIVVVPVLGALGWLLAGRPERELEEPVASRAAGGRLPGLGTRRRAPLAPDDDPAFLRQLADEEWSRRMRDKRAGVAGQAGDSPARHDPVGEVPARPATAPHEETPPDTTSGVPPEAATGTAPDPADH